MSTIADTPPQSAARSALPGYAALVDSKQSKHIAAADEAGRELVAAEKAVVAARNRRHAAIAAAHYEDGMRAPEIARALTHGMSVSNVRLILKTHRP